MNAPTITRRGAFAAPLALAPIATFAETTRGELPAAFARWRASEIAWNEAAEEVARMPGPPAEAEAWSDALYDAAGLAHDALSRLTPASPIETGMLALAALRGKAGDAGLPGMPSDPLAWRPAHFAFRQGDGDLDAIAFRCLWGVVSSSGVLALSDRPAEPPEPPAPDPIFAAFAKWRDAYNSYADACAVYDGEEDPTFTAAAEAESVAAVRLAQTMPTTAAGLPLFFRSLLLATQDAKRGTLPNIAHATADDFVMSGAWADDRDRLAWATALRLSDSMAWGRM